MSILSAKAKLVLKRTGLVTLSLSSASLVSAAPVENNVRYDSPACQISSAWCVGNTLDTSRDYRKNELLLLYDSNEPSRLAEDVLQRYRLTQKRIDDLSSVRTKMLTVATNGQDAKSLVETINQQEKRSMPT